VEARLRTAEPLELQQPPTTLPLPGERAGVRGTAIRLHPFDPRNAKRRLIYRAMLEVIANMAERTLSSRKPTPRAMMMIMTGSIMLVRTRRAMLSSFS
jgi:hypothetical protein